MHWMIVGVTALGMPVVLADKPGLVLEPLVDGEWLLGRCLA